MSCSSCFIANILGFFPPWSAGTSYIEHSDRNILVRNEMHVLVPSLCAVVLIPYKFCFKPCYDLTKFLRSRKNS